MPHQKVFIIAEAGVNHNGSIEIARQMVETAAGAGANAVKFQSFRAEALVTRTADKAEYQKKTSDKNQSQFDMLKKLELSCDSHQALIEACAKTRIEFLSSPFDLDAIDMLKNLGIRRWKIPSGEITNRPYLKKIAAFREPIILSTGMSTLREIEQALKIFEDNGLHRRSITLLHCNTEYPTPMSDVNLQAMQTIQKAFQGVGVGYSDHTQGIEVPIAAVAMGASVIEKHFTLDKAMEGPDHKASLSPEELKQMVRAIRNIEKALGSGIKEPSASEGKNITVVRKSIVAKYPIAKGEKFTEKNLTVKRPGAGISPMQWEDLMGRIAQNDYLKDEFIKNDEKNYDRNHRKG